MKAEKGLQITFSFGKTTKKSLLASCLMVKIYM